MHLILLVAPESLSFEFFKNLILVYAGLLHVEISDSYLLSSSFPGLISHSSLLSLIPSNILAKLFWYSKLFTGLSSSRTTLWTGCIKVISFFGLLKPLFMLFEKLLVKFRFISNPILNSFKNVWHCSKTLLNQNLDLSLVEAENYIAF